MSVDTYTVINCDGPSDDGTDSCGNATHTPFPATATQVRAHRREDGWHTRPGGRDLCPDCWVAGHR
jgi:hypothetical protein